MYSTDDIDVRQFLENNPHTEDTPSSKLFGPENERIINSFVTDCVNRSDDARIKGDKELAGKYDNLVRKIVKDLDNAKGILGEWWVNKNSKKFGLLYEAGSSSTWDKNWAMENSTIGFRPPNFEMVFTAPIGEDGKGKPVMMSKSIKEITRNWITKDDSEAKFMNAKQELVDAGERGEKNPPFDIHYFVDGLINNNKPHLAFDKIGGNYFSANWYGENMEDIASGKIPQEMLTVESFLNPEDNRVHKYYSDILNSAFYSGRGQVIGRDEEVREKVDENYQTTKEEEEADELISKIKA